MRKHLAIKQTDEQRRSNDYTRFQFVMAMMNADYITIKSLLKEDARFLGWMNDWQFCNWLKGQFKEIGSEAFHSRFREQICLDIYPGADMFYFEYAKHREIDSIFGIEENSDPFNENNTVKITLVLVFEDGKISDVRMPKRGIDVTLIKKYQLEN